MSMIKVMLISCISMTLSACAMYFGGIVPPPQHNDQDSLTDAELIAVATQDDREPPPHSTKSIVGIHNGTNVIEAFYCSDDCSEDTLRVVYYDVSSNARCFTIDGVTKSILIPTAMGGTPKDYCFPDVIAEYWQAYP